MANETSDIKQSFFPARKWAIGFHVALSIAAAIALLGMVNYLASRHGVRLHWSDASKQKLAPLTIRALNALTNRVKMIVFFDRREPLFSAVQALAREYEHRAPVVELEVVDYRYPGRAETIRSQYKLSSPSEGSRIIFDVNGRVRTVLASELSDFDISNPKEIRRSAFKGEQLFTSAIVSLTEGGPRKAYFLQGHGEQDPASEEERGFSKFARMLQENNIVTEKLSTLLGVEIPSDCNLLVIASPERVLEEEELGKIEKYLKQGGRMMLLFSFNGLRALTGMERLLAGWNVEVGLNMVRDPIKSQGGDLIVVRSFGSHPAVRPLARSTLTLVAPRSIRQRTGVPTSADAPRVTELAFTSSGGQVLGASRDGKGRVEKEGVIPLIAAIERGGIQGVSTDRGAARLIVAGDSLFLSNMVIEQAANMDFANLAVNWLLSRDLLLEDVPPRAIKEYAINLTQGQLTQMRWVMLGLTPGGALLVGFFVWLRRRT